MDSGDRPPAFSVFTCGGGGVKTTENQYIGPFGCLYKLGGEGGGAVGFEVKKCGQLLL